MMSQGGRVAPRQSGGTEKSLRFLSIDLPVVLKKFVQLRVELLNFVDDHRRLGRALTTEQDFTAGQLQEVTGQELAAGVAGSFGGATDPRQEIVRNNDSRRRLWGRSRHRTI